MGYLLRSGYIAFWFPHAFFRSLLCAFSARTTKRSPVCFVTAPCVPYEFSPEFLPHSLANGHVVTVLYIVVLVTVSYTTHSLYVPQCVPRALRSARKRAFPIDSFPRSHASVRVGFFPATTCSLHSKLPVRSIVFPPYVPRAFRLLCALPDVPRLFAASSRMRLLQRFLPVRFFVHFLVYQRMHSTGFPCDSMGSQWCLYPMHASWAPPCAFSRATIVDLTGVFLVLVTRSFLRLTIRNSVSSFMGFQWVHSLFPSVFAVGSPTRFFTHNTACLPFCVSMFLLPCLALRSAIY